MRPPTVTVIENIVDRELYQVNDIFSDIESDSDQESRELPLKRKVSKHVCFMKAQSAD